MGRPHRVAHPGLDQLHQQPVGEPSEELLRRVGLGHLEAEELPICEKLRAGASPQAAIHAGYEHAWATILDSNITSLIAGIALLAFGSGPVRGFAVVHCLGILTSMFSAVFFSRGLVNLWYGRRKVKSLSIGSVWRPEEDARLTNTASKD